VASRVTAFRSSLDAPTPVSGTAPQASAAPEALAELIARYERPLLQYTHRLVGDSEQAKDVVQEAFLRLVKDGPRDEDHARAWLYTVCRNLAFDQRRQERRVQTPPELSKTDPPTVTELLVKREEGVAVQQLLLQLPANQREVVRLKFQAGLSYKEIAAVTSLSVSNVGFLLHVALKTLRRHFEEERRRSEVQS
jgi:RNA polymerase sigma factor (sigma-70 family)